MRTPWGRGHDAGCQVDAFFAGGSGLKQYTETDMAFHIILGLAIGIMFLLLGCVAFLYLLRGKN
jgi:hypothetical protein